jgi:hypothetical protein
MSRSQAKNCVIVVLAVLAIYLTSQLWFENFSNHNFFYLLFASRAVPANAEEIISFARPYRLIIGYGDDTFAIQYNGLQSESLIKNCDRVIADVLKQGEVDEQNIENYEKILTRPVYIYEYAFTMPSNLFASAFGQKGGTLVNRTAAFSRIALVPALSPNEKTTLFFLQENGEVACVLQSGASLTPPTKIKPDSFVYESAALGGYDALTPNLFVMKFPQGALEYPAIRVTNPYQGKELLMGDVEKNVDSLFTNPTAKLSFTDQDNVYTFIDDNTVVKYYDNDVLDYANYRTSSTDATFLQNFAAAVGFIQADKHIVNEYYLAGYETQDKRTTFYFDLIINDLPLLLPDNYKNTKAPLSHALEITVEEEHVAHYRKLVYNFLPDSATKTAARNLHMTLQSVADYGNELIENQFSDVKLGYKIDRNKQAYLYWVLRLGGGTYSKNAQ